MLKSLKLLLLTVSNIIYFRKKELFPLNNHILEWEKEMFQMANSKFEYFHLIALKLRLALIPPRLHGVTSRSMPQSKEWHKMVTIDLRNHLVQM